MGIIERLQMHNFMCHKYLTFNFGPQINFIIGMFPLSLCVGDSRIDTIKVTMEVGRALFYRLSLLP